MLWPPDTAGQWTPMVTVATVSWRPGSLVTVATWTRVGTRVVCPRVTPMGGGPAPWWRGPSAPHQRGRVVTPSAGSDAKYFPLMLNIFCRFLSSETVCSPASNCSLAVQCHGRNAICSLPQTLPDNTPCQDNSRTCLKGECIGSICLNLGGRNEN